MSTFAFFTILFNIKRRPVRRVVDGLLYDTNDADLIASHRAMRTSHSDKVLEEIYKTSRDHWFLMCQADARHAIRADNTDHVFALPLTLDEAYNWLVEFNEVGALERFFPERLKKA